MRSFPGFCLSDIVYRNRFIYLGTSEGVLHVVGALDGRTRWVYRTGRRRAVAPVVERGVAYLSISDGSLHAVDAFSGRRVWARGAAKPLAEPGTAQRLPGPILLGDSVVYREGRRLVGRAKDDGAIVTTLALPNGDVTFPVEAAGGVIIGVDDDLYAIDPDLVRIRWRTALGDEGPVTPAVFGGTVVAGTRKGSVFAVNVESGRIRWRYGDLPAAVTDVATDGVVVFAVSSTGNVYALSAETGRLLWRFDTEGAFVSRPLTSGASVLFGSNDGRLYSVSADDGRFEWAYDTEDAYVSSLATDGSAAYFAANAHAGERGTTRLVGFDVNRALASLRAFGEGPIRRRREERDTVSTVLVDGAVLAARRVGSTSGVFTMHAWPYRFFSALGNANALVGATTPRRGARVSDSLAVASATLGLTAGPTALLLFTLVFAASALGFLALPRTIPILGALHRVGSAVETPLAVGTQTRRPMRFVLRNPWMLALTFGAELVLVPVFVGMRLIAGPAESFARFVAWGVVSGALALLVAASVRTFLLRGVSQVLAGEPFRVGRCRPRGQMLVRVVTLYVLCGIVLSAVFALIEVSGALSVGWLLAPALMLAAVCVPVMLADCFVVVECLSVPRAYLAAARVLLSRPAALIGLWAGALLTVGMATGIGFVWGDGAALLAALVAAPIASTLLAAESVRICTQSG